MIGKDINISLKEILAKGKTVVALGAFNALFANIAASSGAEIIYMAGFGVSGGISEWCQEKNRREAKTNYDLVPLIQPCAMRTFLILL